MLRNIIINFVPAEQMRYESVGDWYPSCDGTYGIDVMQMTDKRSMLAVAIHEAIESFLCDHHNIAEADVMKWDLDHMDEEPGDNPEAPYHYEHVLATDVEMAVCTALGLSWTEHCAIVDMAFERAFGDESLCAEGGTSV